MIRVKHINAFTPKPFLGNPAAVVTKADGLTTREMQLIAREMNLSETAFVLSPTRPGADLRVRWFTPTIEVNFCGHATVASFHALAEEGRFRILKAGKYSFRLETRSGLLPVSVQKRSKTKSWIQVQLPRFSFFRYGGPLAGIVEALRARRTELHARLPVQIDSRRIVYIPFKSLKSLFEMKPDFERLRRIGEGNHLQGICVFTTETVDSGSTFHSRFFAPNFGINEDPVTGSSNGPLGAYCFLQGLIVPTSGKCIVVGEQGDVLGRRGRVSVEIELGKESIQAVRIAGEAVTVFDAPLRLA